jgi:hypothetical protein
MTSTELDPRDRTPYLLRTTKRDLEHYRRAYFASQDEAIRWRVAAKTAQSWILVLLAVSAVLAVLVVAT